MQFTDADKAFQREFMKLARYQEVSQIKTILRLYRDSPEEWTSNKHSAVIFGIINLIRPFDSKFANDTIIQFYKDFYNHNDMIPSIYTLSMVSSAYLNRSLENWEQYERLKLEENAWKLASSAKEWLSRLPAKGQGLDTSSLFSSSPEQSQGQSEELLATLKQESEKDYQSARTIMYTLGKELKIFPTIPLEQLVKAAAVRGDIDTALRAFGTLEGTPKNKQSRVTYRTYLYLLTAYAKGGDARGVRTIFESFANSPVITYKPALTRRKSASSFLEQSSSQLDPEADKIFGEAQAHSRETQVDVCNAAIYAYLLLGDGVKALDVLERMMSSRKDIEKNVVPPNGNTLLHLVKGFAESGDLESAFRWATRIHAEPKPQDLPEPPSVNDTVDSIIAATSDAKAVEAAAGDSPVLPKLATRVYDLTYGPTLSTKNIGAQEQGSPSLSENSSAGNRTELGSIFSDPSMRSRTLSITPPSRVRAGYASSPNGQKLQPDSRWSHELDDIIRSLRRNEKLHSASHAYLKIKENAKNGIHAHPETLARFLYILAKSDAGSPGAVHEIYKMALDGLAGLDNPADQAAAWAYIEDRMLSYAATVGELAEAAQHRDRLLAAGAAPSADSYAAMIVSAKDTTDDATVAIELFEEARRFGVVPNLFLFNILIGKVSKARRTQLALSYFEQMKAVGIKPSTVTYGSVIAGEYHEAGAVCYSPC